MIKATFASIVLLLFLLPAKAQVVWENQVWTSVQLEKKLIPKTKATLTLESRWNVDPLMAVRYFPNISVSRKWSDLFSTELHYRYITANKGLGYRESSHRLMLDALLSKKINKTDWGFRLRAGREDEAGNYEGIFGFSEFVLRQKLSVKHKFFKQEFSLSVEQFETFTHGTTVFDQRRFVAGMESKIASRQFLNFFVMYQDLIDTRRFNFGVGYTFELDGKKKKKKKEEPGQ
ncbi:MAG: DUF2490 domain-containing protein [Bacteroidia bacterium]